MFGRMECGFGNAWAAHKVQFDPWLVGADPNALEVLAAQLG